MLPKFWIAGEVLDDHLSRAMRSAPCASVTDADHRQELGREPDRQRDREEQRLERVVLERDAHQQDEEHEHDGRAQDQQAEPPQCRARTRSPGATRRSRAAMSPNTVGGPGRDDQRRARAADDRRAEEHQVRRVGPDASRSVRPRRFLGRQRLARQRRLLDGEIARLEQARVGRHQIAGRQPERRRRARRSRAASPARRRRGARWPSALTDARSRSAACCERYDLPEVDRDAEHHHRHDDERVDALSQTHAADRAGDEQDDDERIGEQVRRAERAPTGAGPEPARSVRTARRRAASPLVSPVSALDIGHQDRIVAGRRHILAALQVCKMTQSAVGRWRTL